MPWTIDYFSEDVRQEIAAMPVGIRAAYVRLTELLQELGLDLRMPHSRAMGGGLFELRPRGIIIRDTPHIFYSIDSRGDQSVAFAVSAARTVARPSIQPFSSTIRWHSAYPGWHDVPWPNRSVSSFRPAGNSRPAVRPSIRRFPLW